ncbi:MAG TPA: H-NS family nucleoid-associated regulatory protein [Pseudolabrys sp.]|jgi:DNA-binding protein H-NS|nr:H-NS family nucleoid-associated regulatory protein [Pseudolabrys sp.]
MTAKKSTNSHYSKTSLASLSNEALCKLRDEIAMVLEGRAESLRKELGRLTGDSAVNSGRKTTKAKRVGTIPKYQGPGGKTWGGRGARPRWLSNALDEGRTLDEFLIAPDRSQTT